MKVTNRANAVWHEEQRGRSRIFMVQLYTAVLQASEVSCDEQCTVHNVTTHCNTLHCSNISSANVGTEQVMGEKFSFTPGQSQDSGSERSPVPQQGSVAGQALAGRSTNIHWCVSLFPLGTLGLLAAQLRANKRLKLEAMTRRPETSALNRKISPNPQHENKSLNP